MAYIDRSVAAAVVKTECGRVRQPRQTPPKCRSCRSPPCKGDAAYDCGNPASGNSADADATRTRICFRPTSERGGAGIENPQTSASNRRGLFFC
jgi:hypothetical protein